MAKAKDGISGKFSGRIGDVVLASWKGIPYIRSKPERNPSNTKAQQNQRGKFGLVIAFVNKIRPVINAGFRQDTDRMTELNSATSWLMKQAVTGEFPDLRIDYPSVLVARGDLPKPREAKAALSGRTLTFTWYRDTRFGNDRQRENDRVVALAWCPAAERGVWIAGDGPLRRDGTAELELPEEWGGMGVECYLGFASADGREASDSVYLGRVNV